MLDPSSPFNDPSHRKLVKHYDEPGHAHELTLSCYQRRPLFSNLSLFPLLSHAIDQAMAGQGFELVAFVYMPEHVHLLVWPAAPTAEVSKLLFAIKRPFSYRAKQFLLKDNVLMNELTVQERPGKTTFRFWQEGSGYDRNIRKVETLKKCVDYIHHNPVRRGLCTAPDEYRWSSWKHYHEPGGSDGQLPIVYGWSED